MGRKSKSKPVVATTTGGFLNSKLSFLEQLSTHLYICTEKIENKGEDSAYEYYCEAGGVLGVFDGCGGLGSKACPDLQGKTQAYIAARTISGAVRLWYQDCLNAGINGDADSLKEYMDSYLSQGERFSGDTGFKLKGSLVRPFPSTVAMVTLWKTSNSIISRHFWAGDSRTFLLDETGLCQISVDDIKGGDALSNLTSDGSLTNVASADGNYVLHSRDIEINRPCLVLASSDGCFGYVSSPMAFEWMILHCLMAAQNVDEWNTFLKNMISEVSGDDQSLTLAAFGFDSFDDIKKFFAQEYQRVYGIVKSFEVADEASQLRIWDDYKINYYRFVEIKEDN